MATGSCWMLDSDLGQGDLEETERNFGQSSEDICQEYIVTGWGVGWDDPAMNQ
jgi:hypothetical protein